MEKGARNSTVVFALLIAALLFAGCAFFGPGDAPGAGISLSKADQALLTKSKIADYSYKIKDKTGTDFLTDTVKNSIDKATNRMLDCDILTCDYKVLITAKQALTFDADTLQGKYIGAGVSVQKIFYLDTHIVQKLRPIYTTIVNANGSTIQEENGTETYSVNESFENTAVTTPLSKDEVRTYIIRFKKDNPNINTDIYHSIYGQERKDAAWWNASCLFAFPIDINTTVASNLTNFPAMVSISTSNATLYNSTTCTNVRFLDSTNTTLLNYDLDSNSPVFCGNASNNATYWVGGNYTGSTLTRINLYICPLGTASGENEKAVWTSANYASVYHMDNITNATDITGCNNLTVGGGGSATLGNDYIGSWVRLTGGKYFSRAAVSCMTANVNHVGTESAWVYNSVVTNTSYAALMCHSKAGDAASRCLYQSYGNSAWANLTYSPTFSNLTTPAGAWSYISVGYNGTVKFYSRNTQFFSSATAFSSATINGVSIGDFVGASQPVTDANISEVRWRNETSTTDWLTAEYAQFAIIGTVSGYVPPSPINASLYMQTSTPSYNGTHITYNFTAVVFNQLNTSQDVNVSILVTLNNSTAINVYNGQITLPANGIGLASNTTTIFRPATDSNFTIFTNATNSTSSAVSTSVFMLLPIDPVDAAILKGGSADTDVSIWNGASWVPFTGATQVNFRCSNPFPSYCQPQNQNNATSQAIFRVKNNGTITSTYQAVMTNTTWGANANLTCSKLTTPAGSVQILNTGFKNCTTETLTTNQYIDEYLYFYIVAVPSDFPRDFNLTWRVG
jgi:hypothetical protein